MTKKQRKIAALILVFLLGVALAWGAQEWRYASQRAAFSTLEGLVNQQTVAIEQQTDQVITLRQAVDLCQRRGLLPRPSPTPLGLQ